MEQSFSEEATSHSAGQEIPCPFMESEDSWPCSQEPATGPKPYVTFRNKLISCGKKLLAPRPAS
jgi:hypothetical protein